MQSNGHHVEIITPQPSRKTGKTLYGNSMYIHPCSHVHQYSGTTHLIPRGMTGRDNSTPSAKRCSPMTSSNELSVLEQTAVAHDRRQPCAVPAGRQSRVVRIASSRARRMVMISGICRAREDPNCRGIGDCMYICIYARHNSASRVEKDQYHMRDKIRRDGNEARYSYSYTGTVVTMVKISSA